MPFSPMPKPPAALARRCRSVRDITRLASVRQLLVSFDVAAPAQWIVYCSDGSACRASTTRLPPSVAITFGSSVHSPADAPGGRDHRRLDAHLPHIGVLRAWLEHHHVADF